MGSEITRNQWEVNNDSKGHDLSSMVVLHGSHDHGGLAERGFCDAQVQRQPNGAAAAATTTTDWNLGIGERVLSAAGAAFLSAIVVNPLDVVKVINFSVIYVYFFYFVSWASVFFFWIFRFLNEELFWHFLVVDLSKFYWFIL